MTEVQTEWGRVDDNNTVFVKDAEGWREVGQYPDVSAEEALAYFERKYNDLASQVSLLEARARRGAPAQDVASAVVKLRESVTGAHAVGDLSSLASRLDALSGEVTVLTEAQQAEAAAAREAAIAERTAIVETAEKLATADPKSTQWKRTHSEMEALFARWQEHQKNGPSIPRGVANDLWKRFRTARSTVDAGRRAFYGELESQHKQARAAKQKLVSAAQALAPKGADGIPAYRKLLDEWKKSARAGKKYDDALWEQFKAAGDALYQAKAEVDAVENAAFAENLVAKEAVLSEAQPILEMTDLAAARKALRAIQNKWDAIGKVPREDMKRIEGRLRAIEDHVRGLDEANWKKTDPEKTARAEGLASQLEEAIAELTAELTAAEASGDQARINKTREALEARKAWLSALG